MKRVARVAAVCGGVGERSDDLRELDEGPWPAVRDRDRHRVGILRSLMDEVNIETVDRRRELVELIESPLGRAPVELLLPVRDELFEVREVRSVVPIRAGDLTREARARQPLLEIREDAVSDVDLEWDDCVRSPRRRWT